MDAARYAGMSDPDNNPNFRRRWSAPPLKEKRPPTGGTVERAEFEINGVSERNIGWVFVNFKRTSVAIEVAE
jgi:hypothetical protein